MNCLYCQNTTFAGNTYCCGACAILDGGNFQSLAQKARSLKRQAWAGLDTPAVTAHYNLSPIGDARRFRIYVEGLQCASCIHLLERLPEFDGRIREARVSFPTSEVYVVTTTNLPLSELLQLIHEMGYPPQVLAPQEDGEVQRRGERRRSLRQIAVAGAAAGNIMMFIIPVYSGVGEPYRTPFLWLSFLLFLPILFYSAQAFYPGAWRALKTQTLNIDFAMSLAILGSFSFSTYNLLRDSGEIYYDSTASFVFLILVSRYFVKQAQFKTLENLRTQDHFWNSAYKVKHTQGWIAKTPDQIREGDVLRLDGGQRLPVDGVLVSPNNSWDSSVITGEVWPRTYAVGMKILAGHSALTDAIEVRAVTTSGDSEFQKLWRQVSTEVAQSSPFVRRMDRLAQWLLTGVILGGLLFVFFYSWIDTEAAIQRAIALWVVACPCALAFAAPLALQRSLLKARRSGLLIKDADIFEKTTQLTHLFFDKTGTLTTGRLRLIGCEPSESSARTREIVLQLEQNSSHPVAFAFRKAWADLPRHDLAMTDIHEKIGQKVYGLLDGKLYSLQASSQDSDVLSVELHENSAVIARFEFEDELEENIAEHLQRLQKKFSVHLLTGDKKARAENLARVAGLIPENIHSECSPGDKWKLLQAHPASLMMGDGANDAAALREASVGIAARGSLGLSLQAAGVYSLKPGIAPVLSLIKISHQLQRTLQRNFSLALTYNVVAGACALSGWVSPLVAALLMPLSSAVLLLSTLMEEK